VFSTSHKYVIRVAKKKFIVCCYLNQMHGKDEWLVAINGCTRRKKEIKKGGKKNDLVYEEYTNACKLDANWNGKDFLNHSN